MNLNIPFRITRFALALLSLSLLPAAVHAADPPKIGDTAKGKTLVDARGMTLYTFDRDTSGNASTCDGKCTERWKPLAADNDAEAKGDFTVIIRSDGSKMWAYRYRPLYTSQSDKAPGDVNGFDGANLWHVARPAL